MAPPQKKAHVELSIRWLTKEAGEAGLVTGAGDVMVGSLFPFPRFKHFVGQIQEKCGYRQMKDDISRGQVAAKR